MAPTKPKTSRKQNQPQSAPLPTTISKDARHKFLFNLQRSIRYHRARERFFDGWSNGFSFLSLLSGSAVVVSLLAKAPDLIALTAGGTVAVSQTIEQVWRLSVKARLHNGLASEFSALERLMVLQDGITVSELNELKAEVLSIEAREPPIKRYLDLICYNQVARAIGSDEVAKLSWRERTFAQWLYGDTALET